MTTITHSISQIEQPIIERIDALLCQLREPYSDVVKRVAEMEPLIDDVATAWSVASIPKPSRGLLGRARALRIEFDAIRLKLTTRGKLLARIQREIQEVRGSTYGKTAQRITNTSGRMREKSI